MHTASTSGGYRLPKVLTPLAFALIAGVAMTGAAHAQAAPGEDDVVINEFLVNPTTGREFVELLVVRSGGVDLRGVTLSDVGTRAGATGTTEGDLTLSPTASFLANVPQGTHVVLVLTTPTANANTFTEDTDASDKSLVLLAGGPNLTAAGTLDNATADNLQLYVGSRASGTLIDQVLAGTNSSFIAGATFGDNSGATTADNIDGNPTTAGAQAIPNNAVVRFVPTADSVAAFMDNDTGARFVVEANDAGTPGTANEGVTENSLNSTATPSVIQFSAATFTGSEASTTAVIGLTRSGDTTSAATVTVTSSSATGNTAAAGADFTAAAVTATFAAGSATASVNIPIADDTVDDDSETFTVTLTGPSAGSTVGTQSTATVTITDNDDPGVIQFGAANFSVNEDGTTTGAITLTRTGDASAAASVTVTPTAGAAPSATAGTDFTAGGVIANFGPGATSATVAIPILEDTVDEPNENVTLSLADATGATLGTQSTAVLTIIDNDEAPVATPGTLQFDPAAVSISEDGTQATLSVTRTGGSSGAVSASFATSNGTATAGQDFTATTGTVSFAAGESGSKTITIPILNDTADEADETFSVTLSSPTNGATLGARGTATVTIADDDEPGTRPFSASGFTVNEADGTATVTVTRVGGSAGAASATISATAGTTNGATPGDDFGAPSPTTVAFAAGESGSKTVSVPIVNDTADEPDETVALALSAGAGTTLGAQSTATLTIVDNDAPAVTPSGRIVFAVVGSSLYRFDAATPGNAALVGAAGALGFEPEAIDFSPLTGQLFAIEVGPTTSQLFTIDRATGAAAAAGPAFPSFGSGTSAPGGAVNDYDLRNQAIGFDFNPKTVQADGSIRIRVVASNGSDLRLNPTPAAGAGTVAAVDPRLNGAATDAVGAGYTNNVAQMGGATELLDISAASDTLYLQNPANAGTLVSRGPLGIDAQAASGFDIFTDATGTGNTGYLATNAAAPAGSEFYTVDLAGGTATLVGGISNGSGLNVSALALQPGESVPFVRSIARAPGQASPTTGASVSFTVTFTEPVTGVTADDFAVTTTGGNAAGGTVSVSGSGAVYTVTVSNISGTGTIRLDVVDNNSIVDAASNPLAGAASGAFTTGQTVDIVSAATGALITELRLRGPGGSADEFVEVRNTTDSRLDISGLQLLSNGGVVATAPANTTLAPRAHLLFTGAGYSLSNVAAGDVAYAADIPNGATVSIRGGAGEVDSVSGLSSPTANSQHAFVRLDREGQVRDTGAASDFLLVSEDGTAGGSSAPAVLGVPGPQNSASPVDRSDMFTATAFDSTVSITSRPNQVRVSPQGGDTSQGTILFRRLLSNNTGDQITRLRFRVVRLSTQGNTSGADLRLLSSPTEFRASGSQGTVRVFGVQLEAPATEGAGSSASGGLNASAVSKNADGSFTLNLAQPLEPGERRNYGFLFRVVTSGTFTFALAAEALPAPAAQ